MIGLTGSPIVGGVLFAGQAEVEAVAVPVPTVREGREAREAVAEVVYVVRGRVRWAAMTAAEATDLQAWAAREFDVELRSEAADDPDWATPMEVTVEATSDVKLTESAGRRDAATGEVLYDVELEVEGLAELTRDGLGLNVGAIVLVSEADDSYEIDAEDGATITDRPDLTETITLIDTTEVVVEWAELGGPRTVAARIDSLTDRYHHIIQTRAPAA